jgi:hypothetical protein
LGSLVAVTAAFNAGLALNTARGLALGLLGGIAFVLLGTSPGQIDPGRMNTRIRGRFRGRSEDLPEWLAIVLVFGLVAALVVGLASWLVVALPVAVTIGLGFGFALAALLFVWVELQVPVDDALTVTPQSVLRDDRTVAIVTGLMVWPGFGLVGLAFGPILGLAGGLAFGLTMGLLGGIGNTAWSQFTLLRAWLVVRGRLPWRLMAFLDDAHHRGVLRQAGAVYQFRHARLQDHLVGGSPMSDTG